MAKVEQSDYKIAALSNPLSGKNKRGGFERFEQAIAKFSQILHVAASNPDKIEVALQQIAQENIQVIILNGGDGTLQTVLTYLKHKQDGEFNPTLLLLQAGTTSMAFGDVGCKGKLESIFSKVIQHVDGEHQQLTKIQRPVLRMRLVKSKKTICGMFFGAGAIYSGILYCRQRLHTKGIRGELGPSIAMLWFLLDWITVNKLTVPAKARIRVNDASYISGEFSIIIATTLNRLLMGAYPFWGTECNDSKLTECKDKKVAFSFIKRNPPRAVKAFMRILRGHAPNVEPQADYYQSYYPNTVKLEIENGFTLDGELFGEQGTTSEVNLDAVGTISFLVK